MSKTVIIVGDVHATVPELDECRALVDLVHDTSVKRNADMVIWLGDQFHNHSVLHLETLRFWYDAFAKVSLLGAMKQVALVGNHDRSNDRNSVSHAMMGMGIGGLTIVEDTVSQEILPGVVALSYRFTEEEFLRSLYSPSGKITTLICHQSFAGSMYDNGMYIPDGFDPENVLCKHIVSGHIHKPQSVGKVWYPGAPRWRTASDANQERGIWVVRFSDAGEIESTELISTADVCTPIYHLTDTPEEPAEIPARGVVVVDIKGPVEYLRKRREEFAGDSRIRPRAIPDTQKKVSVRESDGIGNAISRYLNAHEPRFGASKEDLQKICRERISWLKT